MFNQRLKDLIDENGLTIQKFINSSNFKPSIVYTWLQGKSEPTLKNLVAVADYFSCSVEYLIGRTDDLTFGKFKQIPPFDVQLKKILKEKKISQYSLLKNNIITRGHLNGWFNRKSLPTIKNLVTLADYLQVDIDYLLGRV